MTIMRSIIFIIMFNSIVGFISTSNQSKPLNNSIIKTHNHQNNNSQPIGASKLDDPILPGASNLDNPTLNGASKLDNLTLNGVSKLDNPTLNETSRLDDPALSETSKLDDRTLPNLNKFSLNKTMLDRICNSQNNTTRNNETGRQISIDRAHQSISPNNNGTLNSSDSDAEDLVNYTSLKDDNEYNTNASEILPNSSICIHHRRRQHRQRRIPSVFIIIIIIIEIVIFIIGVTGNIMIVLTILTTKSMHSTQNFFVFNLAITDLVTLINLPMKIWQQLAPYLLLPGWPFGEFSCIYVVPIFDIFPSVSILTLVAIYIDRYRAITATLATAASLKYIILLLAGNWIGNYLIVGLPVTFVMTYIAPSQCMANFKSATLRRTYFTLRTVLLYVLPSSIIFFCFVRVNKVLGNSMRFLQRSVTGKSQVVRLKRQKRVMTMFFVIFLTFVICYFPYNTLTIVYHYVPSLGQYPELITSFMHVAAMLGIAYSACNSVILYHLSKAFRVKFQKYLPFLKCFTRLEKEDTIDNHDHRHTTIEDLDDGEETKTNRRFSGANLFSSKGGTFKRRFGPKRPHHPNGETQEHELLENNNITNHDL